MKPILSGPHSGMEIMTAIEYVKAKVKINKPQQPTFAMYTDEHEKLPELTLSIEIILYIWLIQELHNLFYKHQHSPNLQKSSRYCKTIGAGGITMKGA